MTGLANYEIPMCINFTGFHKIGFSLRIVRVCKFKSFLGNLSALQLSEGEMRNQESETQDDPACAARMLARSFHRHAKCLAMKFIEVALSMLLSVVILVAGHRICWIPPDSKCTWRVTSCNAIATSSPTIPLMFRNSKLFSYDRQPLGFYIKLL